jgi:hypothetical protein
MVDIMGQQLVSTLSWGATWRRPSENTGECRRSRGGYAPGLVAGEEVRRRATARLALEVDVGQRLAVGVADDEAGLLLLDGPGRREPAFRHVLGSTPPLNRTTRSRDYREIDLRTRSPVWAIHASNAANAATIAPITTSIVIASLS